MVTPLRRALGPAPRSGTPARLARLRRGASRTGARTPERPVTDAVESLEPRTLLSATVFNPSGVGTGGETELVYHEAALPDFTALPAAGFDVDVHDGLFAPLPNTADYDGTGRFAPLEDTFELHSNTNSRFTVYLDFDGHRTENTAWNRNGRGPFTTPAYDTDGNAAVFGDEERRRIQGIWQRVSEDFLPFDVDVTTEEPPIADLVNDDTARDAYGIRVVVGESFGINAGGVAFLNSFRWDSDTPAFAFPEQVGRSSEKNIAEVISHEVGHTVGLNHDGQGSTEYFAGNGSGETGWAPIMGVGYQRELTQFSDGSYPNASNREDDLAVMTDGFEFGFGYRADDVGSTFGTADELALVGSTGFEIDDAGIIGRNNDFDVFSFTSGSGSIEINGDPAGRAPNLDVLLELFDAAGNLLTTSNPADTLNASIQFAVTAGDYFVRVSGTGKGTPDANGNFAEGYPDYGSLGTYFLTGRLVDPDVGRVADLSVNALDADKAEGDPPAAANDFTFEIVRTGRTDYAASVNWNVRSVSTTAADFVNGRLPGGRVTFAVNETRKVVTVPVVPEFRREQDETFRVVLSNPTARSRIVGAEAFGTIRDDDFLAELNVAAATGPRAEGDAGDTPFTFRVMRRGNTGVQASAFYQVGGEVDENDFEGNQLPFGVVNFGAGETEKEVTVDVRGDRTVERDERLTLTLTAPGDRSAIGAFDDASITVLNDDFARLLVTVLDGPTTSERGDDTRFAVRLSERPDSAVMVRFGTTDATEGVTTARGVRFTPADWDAPQVFTVFGRDDALLDGDVDYAIDFGEMISRDARFGGSDTPDLNLTNIDDDFVPTLAVRALDARKLEGNFGTTEFRFEVRRTVDVDSPVAVRYRLGGTTDNADFAGGRPTAVLRFDAGETVKTVTVNVRADRRVEGDETILFALGTPTSNGRLLGGGRAVSTVIDDDPPQVRVSPVEGMTTGESGRDAVFAVRLSHRPTDAVVVRVRSLDASEGVTDVSSLRFTPDDWLSPQRVTVRGMDDGVLDGNVRYTVAVGPVLSRDSRYHGIDPTDVRLTNEDDERPVVRNPDTPNPRVNNPDVPVITTNPARAGARSAAFRTAATPARATTAGRDRVFAAPATPAPTAGHAAAAFAGDWNPLADPLA